MNNIDIVDMDILKEETFAVRLQLLTFLKQLSVSSSNLVLVTVKPLSVGWQWKRRSTIVSVLRDWVFDHGFLFTLLICRRRVDECCNF